MQNLKHSICHFAAGAVVAFATVLSTATHSPAQDGPVLTITTGGASGTYFRFAEDIAKTLPSDVTLEIVPSDGSVQNLRRLIGYEGQSEQKYYQLALVQADVLEQLKSRARGDDVLESIVDRIKVVMPLYTEEIHAFAKQDRGISGLGDLVNGDYVVNAGGEKSGTNLTTRWLYEQSGNGSKTLDLVNASDGEGLPDLENGIYDVLFYVAGAPVNWGVPSRRSKTLRLCRSRCLNFTTFRIRHTALQRSHGISTLGWSRISKPWPLVHSWSLSTMMTTTPTANKSRS
ncbi:TAXI family TRAP transporter solute-binding subunit [Tateyamaria omphalii]|uniref:C4-dicarboxylate ABC transporter substrate-binding protein n=1 Tax=Tateyamaria omphalii TaxID=299262 RepID=A0A1P8N1Y2_9RHOB|nr:TAXI family TRAP transporter solute-binding subunit [Tateyamaria omphalii]APX14315.1 hypothetical protein BWR18_20700 [Tateyamaria omphalii]